MTLSSRAYGNFQESDKKSKNNIRFFFNKANVCNPNPCGPNGICEATSPSTAICKCSLDYTGFLCEARNPCTLQSNPCLNQATCQPVNFFGKPPTFNCECQFGFIGTNCETNILTNCTPDFCLNGGTCFVDTNTLNTKCSCLPLFTGKNHFSPEFRDF